MECLLPSQNTLPVRLYHTLILSIGLHLLLIWVVAGYIEQPPATLTAHQPKPIQITIGNPLKNRPISTAPATPTKPIVPLKQILNDQTKSQSSIRSKEQPKTATEKNHIGHQIKSDSPRSVTTAKIIATASSIARELANEGSNDTKKDDTSVSAILNKALNPHREAPGVSSLADGTIRVVTEQGITYCIKPMDDGKINGPEDDIRVSGSCN